MLDLMISECRRFLRPAAIFALLHLLVQIMFVRNGFFIMERTLAEQIAFLMLHFIAAVCFAAAQFGSLRQPNRWLWLLHRPLPRQAVFGAMLASALIIVIFTVGLPALAGAVATHWLTDMPVGIRNYAAVPYAVMFAMVGWLVCAAIMLNPHRGAFLVLFVPFVILFNETTAWTAVLVAMATVLLLAMLVYGNFQSDRRTLPKSRIAMAIACVPLVLGSYFFLYWGGTFLYQVGMIAAGQHALNKPGPPPAGGYTEANRSDAQPLLQAGLSVSTDPRAGHWRRQVALAGAVQRIPSVTRHAVQYQLSSSDIVKFENPEEQLKYVFDHAAMRYKGVSPNTFEFGKWIGLGGTGSTVPFPTLPAVAEGFILTEQMALSHDRSSGQLLLRAQVPAAERITAAPKKIGERYYMLTNLRLVTYMPDATKPNAPWIEQSSVRWQQPIDDATFISIAALLDGTLVSTTHLMPRLVGEEGYAQHVYFLDNDGHQSIVTQRKLKRDYPLLFEYATWLTSPVLHVAIDKTTKLFELSGGESHTTWYRIPMPRTEPYPPSQVWTAALLLMALSGTIAWIRQRSIAWTLTSTLFGLPGLIAMLVLTNKPVKD